MREHITAAAIANEIMMDRRFRGVIILLEGISDNRLFKKFFDQKIGRQRVTNGFEKALEVIHLLKARGYRGLYFAILDADFRRLEKKENYDAPIFFIDYHDLEMMLIESSAWRHVLDRYVSEDKLTKFEQTRSLKASLFSFATEIARLRLINHQQKLGLRFKSKDPKKALDYSKFVDKKTLTLIDIDAMVNYFLNLSQQQRLNRMELAFQISAISVETFDQREFCNGHDLIQLLYLALLSAIGSISGKSPADLEGDFILAYDSRDFCSTRLYADLKLWQATHQVSVLVH